MGQDGLNLAGKYGDDFAKIIDNLEPAEAKKAVNLINSYGDEALYSFKEGKDADTYVTFVTYDMKIRGIYTEVPGLATFYAKKRKGQDAGNLRSKRE